MVASTVAEEHETSNVDDLPVDIELISDSTDATLLMETGTSTRVEIDAATTRVVGHLNLLLGEELGSDKDPIVRELFTKAYDLLDLTKRPTERTPTFGAFIYLREVAALTRRLLWIYAQTIGADVG